MSEKRELLEIVSQLVSHIQSADEIELLMLKDIVAELAIETLKRNKELKHVMDSN